MGAVTFTTTTAIWYAHQEPGMTAAMERFAADPTVALYRPNDLTTSLVGPKVLVNGYHIALWLPSGSKGGFPEDDHDRELAALFRRYAVGSGAHVMVVWDYDLGEAHGHLLYHCVCDCEDGCDSECWKKPHACKPGNCSVVSVWEQRHRAEVLGLRANRGGKIMWSFQDQAQRALWDAAAEFAAAAPDGAAQKEPARAIQRAVEGILAPIVEERDELTQFRARVVALCDAYRERLFGDSYAAPSEGWLLRCIQELIDGTRRLPPDEGEG